MGTELRGTRAICGHVGRTWKTVVNLWEKQGFPMTMIGGTWVSDTDQIKEWQVKLLQRR